MSLRLIVRLGIVLIVLVVVALWTSRSPSSGNGPGVTAGDVLLPDLDVNAVASIVIGSADETVRVARKDGTWVAASLFDYPADFSKIRGELRGLSDLKVGQTVRGGNDLLSEFGLSSNVTEVLLQDASGNALANLQLGASRMAKSGGQFGGYPDGQYIRVADGDVVLVPQSLTGFAVRSIDWIDTTLVQVPAPDIITVRVTASDEGEGYVLHIGENDAYAVEGLGEAETIDSVAANRLRSALNYLTFSGVADPASSDVDLGMETAPRYEATTRDGFTYAIDVGAEAEDGRYVRVTVQYEEPGAPAREDAEESLAEFESQEETAESDDPVAEKLVDLTEAHNTKVKEAKKKADELSRFEAWTFVISAHNTDSMTLGRDELVQVEEPASAEDAAEPVEP